MNDDQIPQQDQQQAVDNPMDQQFMVAPPNIRKGNIRMISQVPLDSVEVREERELNNNINRVGQLINFSDRSRWEGLISGTDVAMNEIGTGNMHDDVSLFRDSMYQYIRGGKSDASKILGVDEFNLISDAIGIVKELIEDTQTNMFGRTLNSSVRMASGQVMTISDRVKQGLQQSQDNIARLDELSFARFEQQFKGRNEIDKRVEVARLSVLRGILLEQFKKQATFLKNDDVEEGDGGNGLFYPQSYMKNLVMETSQAHDQDSKRADFLASRVDTKPDNIMKIIPQSNDMKKDAELQLAIVMDRILDEDVKVNAEVSEKQASQLTRKKKQALDEQFEPIDPKTGRPYEYEEDISKGNTLYDSNDSVRYIREYNKLRGEMDLQPLKKKKINGQVVYFETPKAVKVISNKIVAPDFERKFKYMRKIEDIDSSLGGAYTDDQGQIFQKRQYYEPSELFSLLTLTQYRQEQSMLLNPQIDRTKLLRYSKTVDYFGKRGNKELPSASYIFKKNDPFNEFIGVRPLDYLFLGAEQELRLRNIPFYNKNAADLEDEAQLDQLVLGSGPIMRTGLLDQMKTFDLNIKARTMPGRLDNIKPGAADTLMSRKEFRFKEGRNAEYYQYLRLISNKNKYRFFHSTKFYEPEHAPPSKLESEDWYRQGRQSKWWFQQLSSTTVSALKGVYPLALGLGEAFDSEENKAYANATFINAPNLENPAENLDSDQENLNVLNTRKFKNQFMGKLYRVLNHMKLFAKASEVVGLDKGINAMGDILLEDIKNKKDMRKYFSPRQLRKMENLALEATLMEKYSKFRDIEIASRIYTNNMDDDTAMRSDGTMKGTPKYYFLKPTNENESYSIYNFKQAATFQMLKDLSNFYNNTQKMYTFNGIMGSLDQKNPYTNPKFRDYVLSSYVCLNPLATVLGKEMISDYITYGQQFLKKMMASKDTNFVAQALIKGSGKYKNRSVVILPFLSNYDTQIDLTYDYFSQPSYGPKKNKQGPRNVVLIDRLSPYMDKSDTLISMQDIVEGETNIKFDFLQGMEEKNKLAETFRRIDSMDVSFGNWTSFNLMNRLYTDKSAFFDTSEKMMSKAKLQPTWLEKFKQYNQLGVDTPEKERFALLTRNLNIRKRLQNFSNRWNTLSADPMLYTKFKNLMMLTAKTNNGLANRMNIVLGNRTFELEQAKGVTLHLSPVFRPPGFASSVDQLLAEQNFSDSDLVELAAAGGDRTVRNGYQRFVDQYAGVEQLMDRNVINRFNQQYQRFPIVKVGNTFDMLHRINTFARSIQDERYQEEEEEEKKTTSQMEEIDEDLSSTQIGRRRRRRQMIEEDRIDLKKKQKIEFLDIPASINPASVPVQPSESLLDDAVVLENTQGKELATGTLLDLAQPLLKTAEELLPIPEEIKEVFEKVENNLSSLNAVQKEAITDKTNDIIEWQQNVNSGGLIDRLAPQILESDTRKQFLINMTEDLLQQNKQVEDKKPTVDPDTHHDDDNDFQIDEDVLRDAITVDIPKEVIQEQSDEMMALQVYENKQDNVVEEESSKIPSTQQLQRGQEINKYVMNQILGDAANEISAFDEGNNDGGGFDAGNLVDNDFNTIQQVGKSMANGQPSQQRLAITEAEARNEITDAQGKLEELRGQAVECSICYEDLYPQRPNKNLGANMTCCGSDVHISCVPLRDCGTDAECPICKKKSFGLKVIPITSTGLKSVTYLRVDTMEEAQMFAAALAANITQPFDVVNYRYQELLQRGNIGDPTGSMNEWYEDAVASQLDEEIVEAMKDITNKIEDSEQIDTTTAINQRNVALMSDVLSDGKALVSQDTASLIIPSTTSVQNQLAANINMVSQVLVDNAEQLMKADFKQMAAAEEVKNISGDALAAQFPQQPGETNYSYYTRLRSEQMSKDKQTAIAVSVMDQKLEITQEKLLKRLSGSQEMMKAIYTKYVSMGHSLEKIKQSVSKGIDDVQTKEIEAQVMMQNALGVQQELTNVGSKLTQISKTFEKLQKKKLVADEQRRAWLHSENAHVISDVEKNYALTDKRITDMEQTYNNMKKAYSNLIDLKKQVDVEGVQVLDKFQKDLNHIIDESNTIDKVIADLKSKSKKLTGQINKEVKPAFKALHQGINQIESKYDSFNNMERKLQQALGNRDVTTFINDVQAKFQELETLKAEMAKIGDPKQIIAELNKNNQLLSENGRINKAIQEFSTYQKKLLNSVDVLGQSTKKSAEFAKSSLKQLEAYKQQLVSINVPTLDKLIGRLKGAINGNDQAQVKPYEFKSMLEEVTSEINSEIKSRQIEHNKNIGIKNNLQKVITQVQTDQNKVVQVFTGLNSLIKLYNLDDKYKLDESYGAYANNKKKLETLQNDLIAKGNEIDRNQLYVNQLNKDIRRYFEDEQKTLIAYTGTINKVVAMSSQFNLVESDKQILADIGNAIKDGSIIRNDQVFTQVQDKFMIMLRNLRVAMKDREYVKSTAFDVLNQLQQVIKDYNYQQVESIKFDTRLQNLSDQFTLLGQPNLQISATDDYNSIRTKSIQAQQLISSYEQKSKQLQQARSEVSQVLAQTLQAQKDYDNKSQEYNTFIGKLQSKLRRLYVEQGLDDTKVVINNSADLETFNQQVANNLLNKKNDIVKLQSKYEEIKTEIFKYTLQQKELDKNVELLRKAKETSEEQVRRLAFTEQIKTELQTKINERENAMIEFQKGNTAELAKTFDLRKNDLDNLLGSTKNMDKFLASYQGSIDPQVFTFAHEVVNYNSHSDFIEGNLKTIIGMSNFISPSLRSIGKYYAKVNQDILQKFYTEYAQMIALNPDTNYLNLDQTTASKRIEDIQSKLSQYALALKTSKQSFKQMEYIEALWLHDNATQLGKFSNPTAIDSEIDRLGLTAQVAQITNELNSIQSKLQTTNGNNIPMTMNQITSLTKKFDDITDVLKKNMHNTRDARLYKRLNENVGNFITDMQQKLIMSGNQNLNQLLTPNKTAQLGGILTEIFKTNVVKFFKLGESYDNINDTKALLQMLDNTNIFDNSAIKSSDTKEALFQYAKSAFTSMKTGIVQEIAKLTSKTHADLIANMSSEQFDNFVSSVDYAKNYINSQDLISQETREQHFNRQNAQADMIRGVNQQFDELFTQFRQMKYTNNFDRVEYLSPNQAKERMMARQLKMFGNDSRFPGVGVDDREGALLFKNMYFSKMQNQIYAADKSELPQVQKKLNDMRKDVKGRMTQLEWANLRQADSVKYLRDQITDLASYFVNVSTHNSDFDPLSIEQGFNIPNGNLNNLSIEERWRFALDMAMGGDMLIATIYAPVKDMLNEGLMVPEKQLVKLAALDKIIQFARDNYKSIQDMTPQQKQLVFIKSAGDSTAFENYVSSYLGNGQHLDEQLAVMHIEYKKLVETAYASSHAVINNELSLLDILDVEVSNRNRGQSQYDKYQKQKEELEKYEKGIFNMINSQLTKVGLKRFFDGDQQSQEQVRRQVSAQVPRYYPSGGGGGQQQQQQPQQQQQKTWYQQRLNWQSNQQQAGPAAGAQGGGQQQPQNYYMAYPNSSAATTGDFNNDRLSNEAIEIANGVKRIKAGDIEFVKTVKYSNGVLMILNPETGQLRELTDKEKRRYITILAILVVYLYTEVVKNLSAAEKKSAEQRLNKQYGKESGDHPQSDLIQTINELTQKFMQQKGQAPQAAPPQ